MADPAVTILIPHYNTLELTKLCLRLLRKFTDPQMIEIIVIDNASQDGSLDYLRQLSWIELIERSNTPGESPILAHSRALDLALERVKTPYILSIHTDTLVKRHDWLIYLLTEMQKSPTIAGVGSWKLECKPLWRRTAKEVERIAQMAFYRIIGKTTHGLEGVGENFYYLRSHCALYRTDLLIKYCLRFSDGDGLAGKALHQVLVNLGYKMVFLPPSSLIKYLEHINHATTVLNPHLSTRQKSVDKGLQRIEQSLARLNAYDILTDVSLDR